jgi:cytidylate kinase
VASNTSKYPGQKNVPVITIDGASGTGKGAVTHRLARRLHWNLLDSGVLYRTLALAALNKSISLSNEPALAEQAEMLDLQCISSEPEESPRILLSGQDVTETIRTEMIGNTASKISVLPGVRHALLDRQRAFRALPGLVTDGRDMGTVVFPDAQVKIFLTAAPEVRALRRFNQLNEKGIHVNLSGLVQELHERDQRDRERVVAPLRPATDALLIDTDLLTIDQVVERIMTEVHKKLGRGDES